MVCGDCGLGCALKGVESKVIVVPWVSSCMGFLVVWDLYPRAAVCLPEGTNPILHSAGDLRHSAFIDPANCFTIFTRSHSFVHGAFQVPTTMVQVLVVAEDLFACRCKGLWCGV